mmetsp:Transcript_134081/g.428414  ORF Transcript_134081/g.428414 Transcript_134081/m.428414 type:complete len:249 (+) Transcript_134081:1450-2196(+)
MHLALVEPHVSWVVGHALREEAGARLRVVEHVALDDDRGRGLVRGDLRQRWLRRQGLLVASDVVGLRRVGGRLRRRGCGRRCGSATARRGRRRVGAAAAAAIVTAAAGAVVFIVVVAPRSRLRAIGHTLRVPLVDDGTVEATPASRGTRPPFTAALLVVRCHLCRCLRRVLLRPGRRRRRPGDLRAPALQGVQRAIRAVARQALVIGSDGRFLPLVQHRLRGACDDEKTQRQHKGRKWPGEQGHALEK